MTQNANFVFKLCGFTTNLKKKILGYAVDEKKCVLRNEFNIVQLPFYNFYNKACLMFEDLVYILLSKFP